MNEEHDHDLRAIFAHQRRCDQASAPIWRNEHLNPPLPRSSPARRWIPAALATVCVITMAALLSDVARKPEPKLSEVLPPLFDAPPAELFAGIEPPFTEFEAPSDFLLPAHLNLHIP